MNNNAIQTFFKLYLCLFIYLGDVNLIHAQEDETKAFGSFEVPVTSTTPETVDTVITVTPGENVETKNDKREIIEDKNDKNSLSSENQVQEPQNTPSPNNEKVSATEDVTLKKIIKKEPAREIRKEGFVPFEERRQISPEYFAGPNLIYDCKKQHYACVDSVSFERCKNRREQQIKSKSEPLLPCAPLKSYAQLNACVVEIKKVVDLPRRQELCLHAGKNREGL